VGVTFLPIATYNANKYNRKCITITIKLAPEFFDAKLIICITHKPGEGLMQIIGFKIWPQRGN
jgi:hypothetical protein